MRILDSKEHLVLLLNIGLSSVQSLSHVRFFATPRIAACQASLSIINSRSSLKLITIAFLDKGNCFKFYINKNKRHVWWPKAPVIYMLIPRSVKASACNAGDPGSIPGLGRSPGEGSGNPLQYSCLENPKDGRAWWATVHGVAKSRTRLSDFTFFFHHIKS